MAPIVIYIANHSFEAPALAEGTYRLGVGPEWAEWMPEPNDFPNGIQHPAAGFFSAPVADGAQMAFVHTGQIFQWTGETIQGNARYTLQVDIYARLDVGPGLTWPGCEINLYASNPAAGIAASLALVQIPATGPNALSPGEMRTVTLVVDVAAHDIFVGAGVAIVLINLTNQPQANFDNIRFTRDVIPTGVIPISNFSFERPAIAVDQVSADVQGWSIGGDAPSIGVYRPPAGGSVPTDGAQLLFLNSGVISQWLSTLVQVDTVYTLKLDVQIPSAVTDPGLSVQLLANSQAAFALATLHHSANTLAPGQGTTLTLTYTALAGDPAIGQNIGIVFYSTGTPQILVDNVRLTYAPIVVVTEPIITDVTRPQSGESAPQSLTITGTDFPDPPTVNIVGPDSQPVSVSLVSHSSTSIVVSGIFALEGTYVVSVNDSAPFNVEALPPITVPTITSVTRPTAAQGSQSVTIVGTDFPSPPSVTITGPDAQPITLSVISATATHITVTGIFPLAGTYHVTVSGSAPFAVDSAPPVIASVLPPLVSGWAANQLVSIIGSGFHPNPQVTLRDPDGTPRSLFVSTSTSNAILANVSFPQPGPPGTYTLTVDDSPPFAVTSVPRPVITAIDPIYHGITETQDIVIHGTGFAAGQLVQIRDSQNQLVNVRILSVTPTEITVRGTFFQPGDYTFSVWVADPVTVTSIAKPATITYTGPIYDDRSPAGYVGGVLTIGGFGFTASPQGQPPLPVVTITDPNGQPVTFDSVTSQDTWVGAVLHPPLQPGEYTITVDGSAPWRQQSIPYIGYSWVTGVDPPPQAGTYDDQYLTLTGENFPTDVPPSVIVSDPGGQSVTVTVIPPWTSTSVTIRGVFYTNGLWGFRIGQTQIFYINSIPPVGPVATILAVSRPATGSNAEQFLTIQGTLFDAHPTVHITNPSGQAVPFTLLYGSTTAAVISGVFNQAGTWTVQVDNSPPFTVEALPEPATITAIERPQAALTTTQTIRIDGTGFAAEPVVTVTGPNGQPIDVSVVSSSDSAITIQLPPDLPEGVYNVSADYSPPYAVLALPIPIPTLTSATAIQSGLTATQAVTLSGTWMRDPVTMSVVGPQGPVPVTVVSSTREQVEVSGVFLYPGSYTFTVTADGRTSLPLTVNALPPAPPTITDIQPRPQAGLSTPQSLTLQTTGFLTGPAVTVTGPDGLNVPVSLVSAPLAPLGGPVTVAGVFWLEGDYTFTVDGSAPYTVTAIPVPRITAVQEPQAGESAPQTITITGTDFPAGSTVTVIDPNGQPVAVTVDSVTSTAITVTGVFYWPGTYTFRAGLNPLSSPFSVETLTPIPVITGVTRPQAGQDTPQLVTITGLWFPDPATVTVTGPSGPIEVSIVSQTGSAIVVSGIFEEEGTYTFTVSNSGPFAVDAIPIPPPPPPVITNVTPPQWGTQNTQYLTLTGELFRPDSVVTVHAPAGPDVPVTIVDIAAPSTIVISGVFEREGIYAFQVDDSNVFYVEALPPPPPPFITDVTPPQYGTNAVQAIKISGTNFPGVTPDSQLIVHVIGPDGQPIDVTVVSNTSDTIIIWGRFPLEGVYTFQVGDGEVWSNVFSVEAVEAPTPPVVYSYPIRRVREFQLPSSPDNRRMFISRLELVMRTGIGKLHDPGPGSGMNPQVMMQLSRDGGKTWGPEIWRHAGNMGEYLRRVRWLRLGYYRNAVIRLAFSVPVSWQLISLSGDVKAGSN